MGIEETPPPPKQRSITFLSMEEQGTNYIDYTCKVGGILTIDNLIKKNLPLVNCCCLCQCDEETMDHLLLHCKIAHALWCEAFFFMLGVQWVMPRTVISLLFTWRNWLGNYFSNVWNMVPVCLM